MPLTDNRLAEAVRRKNAMAALQHTEGWQMLVLILTEIRSLRATELVTNPVVADGLYAQEFAKGIIQGLQLAIDTPTTLVEESQAVISGFDEVEEREEEVDNAA